MSGFQRYGSLQFIFFLSCLSLRSLSVLANDPSSASKTKNSDAKRSSSVGVKIVIICLGVVTVIAFSVFLFKVWQKKKREEQHARLLKLFEDDDELEVELGLRD